MANDKATSTPVEEQDIITSNKVTVYLPAGDVFNELPVTLKDMIVTLAKIKHSSEFLAGHSTDKDVRSFCVSWLRDTVKNLHEQKMAQVQLQNENKARKYYTMLRASGISVVDASKASGYNPLV